MEKGPPDGSQYPPHYDAAFGQAYGEPSNQAYGAPSGDNVYVGPYGQQPMQYGQPYGQPPPQGVYGQQVVNVTAPAHTVVIQQPLARPPNYMWLSCLVYWCCNLICGLVAFGLSMASSDAADENRMDEAKNYGRASLWTSVAGVVCGVITIIVLIVVYVTVWNQHEDYIDTYWSNNN